MAARPIDRLLDEYGESHKNETNKAVHWVCVPVIVWCVLALLWALPSPSAFAVLPGLNWATLTLTLALIYYVRLSPSLAVGFLVFALVSVALLHLYTGWAPMPLWLFALILFVLAWLGQFWGHKIEGKRPSFLKDVQFLLIGPAWLMHFLYRRLGIPY